MDIYHELIDAAAYLATCSKIILPHDLDQYVARQEENRQLAIRLRACADQYKNESLEGYVDIKKTAAYFDVAPATIRRWTALGCPTVICSSTRRYKLAEVEKWLSEVAPTLPVKKRGFKPRDASSHAK